MSLFITECSKNSDSKNYKGEAKDKKEGGANVATLNLDRVPSDLLLALDQAGAL
jgi:hypothetical protein